MVDQEKVNDAIEYLDGMGKKELANVVRVLMVQDADHIAELATLRDKLEKAEKDVQRMDWIIDNYTGTGGGNGFEVRVWIPVDTECVRHGIDEAIRVAEGKTK